MKFKLKKLTLLGTNFVYRIGSNREIKTTTTTTTKEESQQYGKKDRPGFCSSMQGCFVGVVVVVTKTVETHKEL